MTSKLDISILRICTKCGVTKSLADFHKRGNNFRTACKICTNIQNRSIYRNNHDSHLEAKRRYRNENPEARKATVNSYDRKHIEKRRAHSTVKHAIETGYLLRASDCICSECENFADVYHHDSYDRSHWLDVRPLCRICHGKEHQKI